MEGLQYRNTRMRSVVEELCGVALSQRAQTSCVINLLMFVGGMQTLHVPTLNRPNEIIQLHHTRAPHMLPTQKKTSENSIRVPRLQTRHFGFLYGRLFFHSPISLHTTMIEKYKRCPKLLSMRAF